MGMIKWSWWRLFAFEVERLEKYVNALANYPIKKKYG